MILKPKDKFAPAACRGEGRGAAYRGGCPIRANVILVFCLFLFTGFASASARQKVIVAFGDSTTAPRHGVVTYSQILRQKLNATVFNAGVPGDTTERARKRFDKDVLACNPNLVIIQFGLNDSAVDVWRTPPAAAPRVSLARYRQNLEYFVKTLRQRHSKIILMTPNPQCWTPKLKVLYGKPPYRPEEEGGMNVMLIHYVKAVREIAKADNIPLVDVFKIFSAYGASKCSLLLDGMHPNDRGHRIIANHLLIQMRAASASVLSQ